MIILGNNRAAEFAHMALMMHTLEQSSRAVVITPSHSDLLIQQRGFSVRPEFDYPKVALWRYDKDLPNLNKHRETCIKNRRKRKSKRKAKY